MKIALVTTTINVPRVLRWYRACSTHIKFIIVGDEKTPHDDVTALCAALGADYVHPERHSHWRCNAAIGANSIQKRNIGFLEALKWGAHVVISIDDDNAPLGPHYFEDYRKVFQQPFSGLMAHTTGFFDIGDFLFPRQKQRGIPYNNDAGLEIDSAVDVRVGVAQGLCIGAADVDAATRFSGTPVVHQVSEVARAGLVVDPLSNTVWNSQNTAIVRELLPAWGMVPHVGRMDDIYASVICHRIMREYGYYAHFGLPMVFQQRNAHNTIKDMRAEIDGYERVAMLADALDHLQLIGDSVIADCRRIWGLISAMALLPAQSIEAMEAYLDDCGSVL